MTSTPNYTITPQVVRLISDISEEIGRYSAQIASNMTPQLRRENRIRTIQASLEIENNTLTLEQVTAVLEGKRVMGLPQEIQEVRNAFAAYEALDELEAISKKDLLRAHKFLMKGLVDDLGVFRSTDVGIFRGKKLLHMAPPADRVAYLMQDLLDWLKSTEEHPLVTSSVFHYELEFIHPFIDANGRIGRLWQTLILSEWKPMFAYLPIEAVIRDRQDEYYAVLAQSDRQGSATIFIEFLLDSLLSAVKEAESTDPVIDQVERLPKPLLKESWGVRSL